MEIIYKPRVGCPTKLTPNVKKIIVAQVEKDLSITNAARIARIHPESIKNWMKLGFEDAKEDKKTVFAQFFVEVREAQGKKISDLLEKIEDGQKNWQGIAWKLEKCCSEDFGRDSEVYRMLLEDYKKLLQDMVELKKSPPQGMQNGKG